MIFESIDLLQVFLFQKYSTNIMCSNCYDILLNGNIYTLKIRTVVCPAYHTETGHVSEHIEAETKWPPFSDNIFKCIFLNANV